MSYVAKTYEFFQRIYHIISGKTFQTVFIAISAFVLFLGTMNAYAADETSYKVQPDWSGVKTYSNTASGVDADEDNMTTHLGQETTNTLWNVIIYAAPDITVGADEIASNPDIPADLKLGLLGVTDKAIAMVYENTPSINVVAHLQEEWVPGYEKTTSGIYAADDSESVNGYTSLIDAGIAPLWSKLRDVAYIAFVIIMIVIGFMIMFRSKLGGQTLVTLGNTIPNVIVSLILVTFSFAIAGIIMDIGGFLISLIHSLFDGQTVSIANLGQLMSSLFVGLGAQAKEAVGGLAITSITSGAIGTLVGAIAIGGVGGIVGGALVGGLIVLIILVIGIAIVFIGAIKLLIVLFKAYFQLLLDVILSPLQIMIGTIPGKSATRTNVFLSIARNVLVFPITYFIINIPIYLSTLSDGLNISFPDKLTGASLAGVDAGNGLELNSGFLGLIISFVFRVFVLYFACQAPKFAESIIPPIIENKGFTDAMTGAKESLGKIPLVGSMFK